MSDQLFNKLEIYGKENQVKEVRDFLHSEPTQHEPSMYIDFNNIVPNPNVLESIIWNYDNWGTKYNAFYQESENPNTISFVTMNYGVPSLMVKLSEKFPEVIFIYHFDLPDVMMDPEVSLLIKNGWFVEIPQNCYNYENKEDTVLLPLFDFSDTTIDPENLHFIADYTEVKVPKGYFGNNHDEGIYSILERIYKSMDYSPIR